MGGSQIQMCVNAECVKKARVTTGLPEPADSLNLLIFKTFSMVYLVRFPSPAFSYAPENALTGVFGVFVSWDTGFLLRTGYLFGLLGLFSRLCDMIITKRQGY